MLDLRHNYPRARAALPVVVLACGLLSTSCEPVNEEVCLPKHAMFAGPLCASQICIPMEPSARLLSDATDKAASLTCVGCEQPGPTQFRLEVAVGGPGTGDWFNRANSSGSLALREQWDRSFTVSSLNAALQDSSLELRNVVTTSSGERVLMAGYHVDSGDVMAASQSGDRVRLTLRGHLRTAAVPDPLASPDCRSYVAGCSCGYGGSDVPASSETQMIEVDLPYRVYQP